ncbi:rho GTPase-activating protein gacK isoform X3 [Eurytemora carolleeae]|uniref:rho GTPase-activating protein gacK isoform X3 n=1 Tax=Eurytemora carolleeae TaxID=1294199 RepID=UPI000C76E9CD|nr:rho GTPase-activating protein gacK isoform X3 [Eurytemora carolleeae]|eukprot:XP_023329521.1 rho GTPase-activating protein gacK-like isoform X3 [Eurytemora affinis]
MHLYLYMFGKLFALVATVHAVPTPQTWGIGTGQEYLDYSETTTPQGTRKGYAIPKGPPPTTSPSPTLTPPPCSNFQELISPPPGMVTRPPPQKGYQPPRCPPSTTARTVPPPTTTTRRTTTTTRRTTTTTTRRTTTPTLTIPTTVSPCRPVTLPPCFQTTLPPCPLVTTRSPIIQTTQHSKGYARPVVQDSSSSRDYFKESSRLENDQETNGPGSNGIQFGDEDQAPQGLNVLRKQRRNQMRLYGSFLKGDSALDAGQGYHSSNQAQYTRKRNPRFERRSTQINSTIRMNTFDEQNDNILDSVDQDVKLRESRLDEEELYRNFYGIGGTEKKRLGSALQIILGNIENSPVQQTNQIRQTMEKPSMKEKDNLNHEDVAGPEEFILMELRSQPEEMIPKQRSYNAPA